MEARYLAHGWESAQGECYGDVHHYGRIGSPFGSTVDHQFSTKVKGQLLKTTTMAPLSDIGIVA